MLSVFNLVRLRVGVWVTVPLACDFVVEGMDDRLSDRVECRLLLERERLLLLERSEEWDCVVECVVVEFRFVPVAVG